MSRVRVVLSAVFGLIMLLLGAALFVWGLYWLLSQMLAGVAALDKQVVAALVTGSSVALASVASVIISKHLERQREIEFRHRDKKAEIYETFMERWFSILLSSTKGIQDASIQDPPRLNQDEFLQFLTEFTRKLILWGSNGVVKKYSDFRRGATSYPQDPAILFRFEGVLYEIRKDLGNSNRNLKKSDLLSLFINDVEKLREALANSSKKG